MPKCVDSQQTSSPSCKEPVVLPPIMRSALESRDLWKSTLHAKSKHVSGEAAMTVCIFSSLAAMIMLLIVRGLRKTAESVRNVNLS